MSPEAIGWIVVVLGVVLAFTGARLFWLAVGIAGFALGWLVTGYFFGSASELSQVLVGLVLGVVGALVAIRGLPAIAVGLGGVLIGLLGMSLASTWFDGTIIARILGFVIGAFIGGMLVKAGINWGVPLVTAVGGGMLVWNGLIDALGKSSPTNTTVPLVVGVIVAVLGFISQLKSAPKPA